MSWLFPFYLLGAGAILAPILMHLRKKPPQDRIEFSSLMFLDASPRQPVKKRRLDHWLLLLLRCLVLIVLALMFARPWFAAPLTEGGQSGQAIVILIDQSASMRRENLWPQAVAAAKEAIAGLTSEDRCAIGLFHHKLMPVWTFSDDTGEETRARRYEIASARLDESEPSWHRTNLGTALIAAADRLTTSDVAAFSKRRILVISDFQSGCDLDALRSYAWPQDIIVEVKSLSVSDTNNLSLAHAQSIADTSESTGIPAASAANKNSQLTRFRIENARDATNGDYVLRWADNSLAADGFLPPGVSRIVSSPAPDSTTGLISATLTGDAHDYDNTVHLPPAQPNVVRVLLLGSEEDVNATANPLFYVQRALQPTPELQPVVSTRTSVPLASQLAGTDVAVLPHALTDAAETDALKAWVKTGGLLITIADSQSLAPLLELPDLKITDANVSDYQMIASFDDAHPMMAPFRDSRLRDFTKVHFWKYRHLSPTSGLLTLATFDNGDPAILLRSLGSGSVLLMTSGWHPADSQLALSTKFVPLLFGWLAGSGFSMENENEITLGEALTLTANDPTRVTNPSGEVSELAPGDAMIAHEPGFYFLESQSGAKRILAANLAPEESRTSPMELTALSELGVTLSDSAISTPSEVAVQATLAATERESQQRIWWYLLLAVLALLAGETWIANQKPKSLGDQPITA